MLLVFYCPSILPIRHNSRFYVPTTITDHVKNSPIKRTGFCRVHFYVLTQLQVCGTGERRHLSNFNYPLLFLTSAWPGTPLSTTLRGPTINRTCILYNRLECDIDILIDSFTYFVMVLQPPRHDVRISFYVKH